MGICLSCLRGSFDDDYDETTPLIGENEPVSTLQQQQEEQILEQRNKELNNILNATNDQLIDLTGFLQAQAQPAFKDPASPSLQNQAVQKQIENQTLASVPSLDQQLTPQLQATAANDSSAGVSNGQSQIEVLDHHEISEEMEKELSILKDNLGSPFERCTSIDTANVGPLKIEFQ
ncbi:hypothetical protein OGAPHI_001303 [Ogataea philodendri]|uniref:Uncharacterized protein n=1 Tax=Ogataea philodendri TaxID=1378263 RepID=A0A9P8PEY5_9ASCO|nr:uncharacterized protein OGAPHI_001303 [Ogataea philodendri]KAH3670787.1 hypothetical protein OGAPHI_001303 [Ogataea philodendri]